ncbi:MAG: protein kinase/lanthionine synthetase C family protein [Bifidobacteriaceae bacterium]|nr:protein kinase/lanthionine synthetase C family protein [Bifidobacteriaceae bacterium]
MPQFVAPPSEIQDLVDSRLHPSDGSGSALLSAYEVKRAIHFSNAGGVYLAERKSDGNTVIIKEGRRLAGVDSAGDCGYSRVVREAEYLQRLLPVPSVVDFCDLLVEGNHVFLVEEFVAGTSLYQWAAQNYPFSYCDELESYFNQVEGIVRALQAAVAEVHTKGVALNDAQPRNMMITHDGVTRLIDLETASELRQARMPSIGTHGFTPARECDSRSRDLYGVAQTAMFLLFPQTPLAFLSDAVWSSQLAQVHRLFGRRASNLLSDAKSEALEAFDSDPPLLPLRPPLKASRNRRQVARLRGGLADGLCCEAELDPTTARLFPGDPLQFEGCGLVDLETGAAGVGLMLHRIGRVNPLISEWIGSPGQERSDGRGLLRGPLGVALYLAEVGREEQARKWLDLSTAELIGADWSMRTGVAGRILGVLSLGGDQGKDDALGRHLLRLANRLATAIDEDPLTSSSSRTGEPVGLFDGWSGAGIAMLALFVATGESNYLVLARKAIDKDLNRLAVARDDSLQVDDTDRLLPYLEHGSGGVGYALGLLARINPTEADHANLVRIARACRVRCTVEAGLFSGRAGLVAVLNSLPLAEIDGTPKTEIVEEQVQLLCGAALSDPDSIALHVPGKGNYRLSCDYSTGSAGVMATLDAVANGTDSWFPYLWPEFASDLSQDLPAQGSTENRNGRHSTSRGEVDELDSVTAGTRRGRRAPGELEHDES